MGAKVFPRGADKMPGRICKAACRNEGGVAAVRDKAYFLAVRRFGAGQPVFGGHGADIIFFKFAQRKAQARENVLLKGVQHIALVARGALGPCNVEGAAALHHTGIMPAGKVRNAKPRRCICQRAEFYKWVARHAGAGRAPGTVCLAEGLHHGVLKRFARVRHMKGNGKLPRGLPRLFQRGLMRV